MYIIIGIIIIAIICFLIYYKRLPSRGNTIPNDHISTLVRQAARWSTAATQDQSPLIAVLHANYGAGYLWALKDIATQEQISKVVDPIRFEREIVKVQDNATRKMAQVCPQYATQNAAYLAAIAGEGIINTG